MRFRLFRSRAFWFGVPGLAFLLWAWGDSMHHVFSMWIKGKAEIRAMQVGGTVKFDAWRDSNSFFAGPTEFVVSRTSTPDYQSAAREWVSREIDLGRMIGDGKDLSVSLRHRTLVFGYMVPWLVVIAWRWKSVRGVAPVS